MDNLAGFRPMLGATVEDVTTLRYPLLASPKLDGIRAIWWDGQLYSRTLKPIPNVALTLRMREVCDKHRWKFNGLEGELIAGAPHGEGVFARTSSKVMTRNENSEDVTFWTFDNITDGSGFQDRLHALPLRTGFTSKVLHLMMHSAEEAAGFEEQAVEEGYEGIILRDPDGLYKMGRSTLTEQGLLKVKRVHDSEAVVVGFEEKMHNANDAKLDERGYTKRSSHKANQVPMGTLGALIVNWKGRTLGIGSGFTDQERQEIWRNPLRYTGKLAKFKYLPTVKELPRHPVFLGWRNKDDL